MEEIKFLNGTGAQGIINEIKNRLSNKQDIIQKATLPTASATEEGKIYQYVGTVGNELTHGYFYTCVDNDGTYSWVEIPVQASEINDSSVSSSTTYSSSKINELVKGFAITATGTDITLTDAADEYVRNVIIKGHSEEVNGEIVNVGDNGLTVTTCGKNLFNKIDYTEYRTIASDGTLTNRGTYGVSGYIKCKPETQYYLTNVGGSDEVRSAYCYDKNENGLGACSVDGGSVTSGAITTLANTAYIRICCEIAEVDGVQVEEGATATAYEAYKSTTATITTELPLRSTLDGTVYDEINGKNIITRCLVSSNDEIIPRTTPIITTLTAAEKTALMGLKTYSGTTHIYATDAPVLAVQYFNNSDEGQIVAHIEQELLGKQSKITQTPDVTLTANGWDTITKQQTVIVPMTTPINSSIDRHVIDITAGTEKKWAEAGIEYVSCSTTGTFLNNQLTIQDTITFKCENIPEEALTFRVTSMEVN